MVQYHQRNKQKLYKELVQLGIQDPQVLEALFSVPREQFVDSAIAHRAWDNCSLPIGAGQTISQPYMVAKMTELLNLSVEAKVLEIGTGSGYQTAILAQFTEQVYTVERIKRLQIMARRRLRALDLHKIQYRHNDGWLGWLTKGPFDAIIVTAAADSIPEALIEQLAPNGRLVIPIGKEQQALNLITKNEGELKIQTVEAVKFVPLVAGDLI